MNILMPQNFVKRRKKIRFNQIGDVIWTYAILIVVCAIFAFPVLWLALASFSKSGTLGSFNGFFPQSYSFDSFKNLFTDTVWYNYPKWFGNTLFIAALSCIFATILVILTPPMLCRGSSLRPVKCL